MFYPSDTCVDCSWTLFFVVEWAFHLSGHWPNTNTHLIMDSHAHAHSHTRTHTHTQMICAAGMHGTYFSLMLVTINDATEHPCHGLYVRPRVPLVNCIPSVLFS